MTLAHHRTPGATPTIVFLPGYASDMAGIKAVALEDWARANGRAYLRFDYRGCGESPGDFADQTLADWRDDALAMIDSVEGPMVLVGSSMGGWIMLLAALARPGKVAGLVGIAPAPDFTDWGFDPAERATLAAGGDLRTPSPYSPEPTLTTAAFWRSGQANLIGDDVAFTGPVRIVQGQRDAEVPWQHSVALAEKLRSDDVQVWLVKQGDHRLSREQDIASIQAAVEDVIAAL